MSGPRRIEAAMVAGLTVALFCVGVATLGPAPAGATASFSFTRLAGADRYGTAAAIATKTFATADTVLVATGQNFPDALAGNYLAGARGAPILLTTTNAPVPAATLGALSALHTKNVTLLGLTAAISASVADELSHTHSTSAGGGDLVVSRIGGASRYDTMEAIAQTPATATIGTVAGKRTAIVASGANFPDALSGGPLSFAKAFP